MKGITIDALPKLHLPGDEKFMSYKSSLQEYCQKKKISIPHYEAVKEGSSLVGTVSFSCSYVKCEEMAASVKEADSRAAYEALKQLGYLQGHKFEMPGNGLKRKGEPMATNSKQIKPGTILPVTPKGRLHEITNKKQLGNPIYNTVTVPGGFFFHRHSWRKPV